MKKNLITALIVTGILWAVHLVIQPIFELMSVHEIQEYGIKPRRADGLFGILLSPFLHANWGHLISNSIPLFILTYLILQFYKKLWLPVTIFSVLLGGFAVWLFAQSNSVHIGASGVIFAYIAFLLFSGIFRKKFVPILIGLIVLILYGGALFRGIIPGQQGISWQGHLFGAIAGVLAAYLYRNKYRNEDNNFIKK